MRNHRQDCPICDKIDVAIKGRSYADKVELLLKPAEVITLTKVSIKMYKSLGTLATQLNMPQFPPQGAK
jgi:hypothetical protein